MPVALHSNEEKTTPARVEAPAATIEKTPERHTVDPLPTFRRTGKRLRRAARLTRRGAVIVLAVIGVLGGRWWQAIQPAYHPDLSPRGLMEPEVRGPNAAHFYAAAMDTLQELPKSVPRGDLFDAPLSMQRAEAACNAESLRLLHEGAGYGFYGWQGGKSRQPGTNPQRTLNFVQLLELAGTAAGASRAMAADGRRVEAMETSADILALGRHTGQGEGAPTDTSLVSEMMGLVVEGTGLRAVEVNAQSLTAAEARVALRRLESLPTRVPLALALAGDYRQSVAQLETMLQSAGTGEMGSLAFPEATYPIYRRPAVVNGMLDRYLLLRYGRQGMVDALVGTYRERIRRAALPYQEAKRLAPVVSPAPLLNDYREAMIERGLSTAALFDTRLARLKARLAIQVYRAEHAGRAPRSLDALVDDGYLNSVPADAFSASADAPLRYDPATGKVWSVGENGIDERGAGDDSLERT